MPMIKVRGAFLHVQVYGRGTPILFIHPPMLTGLNFIYQMQELSSDFQIITFDIRGHGHSTSSEGEPITYTLVAEDMVGILDKLGIEKVYIAGYSTGTGIALEFLLKYPERGLGLINISGMSEVSDWTLTKEIQLGAFLAGKGMTKLLAASISWSNSNDRELAIKLFRDSRNADPASVKQYYETSYKYRCTEDLWKISQPSLSVYGDQDLQFYKYAAKIHKGLPYDQLVYIRDGNHQLPTKSAIELNDLIKAFIYQHQKVENPTQFVPLPELLQQDKEGPSLLK